MGAQTMSVYGCTDYERLIRDIIHDPQRLEVAGPGALLRAMAPSLPSADG